MKTIGRAVALLVEGAMLGASVSFLVAVGILVTGLATGYATVPGVLTAWTETSARGGVLAFDPTWSGILTLAIGAAVVCVVARAIGARRLARVLA